MVLCRLIREEWQELTPVIFFYVLIPTAGHLAILPFGEIDLLKQ